MNDKLKATLTFERLIRRDPKMLTFEYEDEQGNIWLLDGYMTGYKCEVDEGVEIEELEMVEVDIWNEKEEG